MILGMDTGPDWNSFTRKQASERWCRQSAAMGRALTELVVREAEVEPGMEVLDVACGSGEPAISIAMKLNGTGRVVGIDISTEPLGVARERAAQRQLTNVSFQQADVAQLPFEDDRFDRVTCRLGIMFFPDISRALTEIRRVLRPDGRFVAAAWGPLAQTYFDLTIGTVRRLIPDLQVSEPKLMFRFGDPAAARSALSAAGFVNVHAELRTVPWNWEGSPDELWQYFQGVTVPFAPLLNAIPKDRKGEVDREVTAGLSHLYDGDAVRLEAQFTLATAMKA